MGDLWTDEARAIGKRISALHQEIGVPAALDPLPRDWEAYEALRAGKHVTWIPDLNCPHELRWGDIPDAPPHLVCAKCGAVYSC